MHSFAIDITGNTKKHSHKSEDRVYIHSGFIGVMSIGHNYSVIGKKEDGGWMLPAAIDRVPHSDNKFDFSVTQAELSWIKSPKGIHQSLLEIQHIHAINLYTILANVRML